METVRELYTLLEFIELMFKELSETQMRISPKRSIGTTIQATHRKRFGIPQWDDIAWIYVRDITLLDEDFLPVFKTLLRGYEDYSGYTDGRIILSDRKKPHWLEE